MLIIKYIILRSYIFCISAVRNTIEFRPIDMTEVYMIFQKRQYIFENKNFQNHFSDRLYSAVCMI